jgi:NADH:ubiquinone oxidoreductase subunit
MIKFLNFFGADKFVKTFREMRQNGGFRASVAKLYRMEIMKTGTFVGKDKYGNHYYEDLSYFFGRSRWVEYPKYKNLDYNASQVPAEWFGWLHYRTDHPPHENIMKITTQHKWMLDHSENMTGTQDAYMPYSTTKPKLEAWDPKKKD